MQRGLLVAGQLSVLFPLSEIPCQNIGRTSNPDFGIHKLDSDPNILEHASHACVLHTPATGTVLLRVIHSGHILELSSLSSNVTSIRFRFPSPVCFSPAVFLENDTQIHILAVTESASLFLITIPIHSPLELWGPSQSHYIWTEYPIRSVSVPFRGLVHVQGVDCVGLALPNGSLLRLDKQDHGTWSENLFHPGSFFSSLSSFLPTIGSTSDDRHQIISMASHSWPTDMNHIWTLSRDRTLRFWKARMGCVASKTIPPSSHLREPSPSKSPEPRALLDPAPQTLLRVFSSFDDESQVYVMVYMPPSTPSTSGGTFHIFTVIREQMQDIGEIDCVDRSGHCHLQDFLVLGDTIHALWDFQGQSLLDKMEINISDMSRETFRPTFWLTSAHSEAQELGPGYLEKLLLSPGAFTEKYMEAILRPGLFSPLTLKTAIDQYTHIHSSLPGELPPQLEASYSSVAENIASVVGCTVQLHRDVHTGSFQYDNYWNALRRDWEGFVARCREIERSARWPLILGVQGPGDIIIVERERVGAFVFDDSPIHLHRAITAGIPHDGPPNELITMLWTIREKLGPAVLSTLESQLFELLHREVSFSFPDAIQDLTRRTGFHENIDEGLSSWVTGRLQAIQNLDTAIRSTLDLVGALDVEVKMEEDEIELLLPVPQSDWAIELASSYVTITAHARYEICLALMTILFVLSEELHSWDPHLVAEVFAVFRGIAIVHYISRQPSRFHSPHSVDRASPTSEVTSQLHDLQVSRSLQSHPPHSLLHRLISQFSSPGSLPGSAHRFLDSTGLLQSVTPALSTKEEVLFCDKLRSLGHHLHAQEVLSWLPRSPPMVYVLGRLSLDIGRLEDAASLFEGLSPCFGPERALSVEDQSALGSLLPNVDSYFTFCLFIASLFASARAVQQQIPFLEAALSETPPDADVSAQWVMLVNAHTEVCSYDNAYTTLVRCPYEFLKRDCVTNLVYSVCEDNANQRLFEFNFGNLTPYVEEALAFKTRNVDPRATPCYSRILYAWYISRAKYREAAAVMYLQAQKLKSNSTDREQVQDSIQEQLEAYNIAINSLCLLDEPNPSIIVPTFSSKRGEFQQARRITRYIPDEKYTIGKSDDELVNLVDIRYERSLLTAQLDFLADDADLPSTHPSNVIFPPHSMVLKLTQSNRFASAIRTAWALNIEMTDIFNRLAKQCMQLPQFGVSLDVDWQLSDTASSWSGTPAERGWRYLRLSLEQYDGPQTDYKYRKGVFETCLQFSEGATPPWLYDTLLNYDPSFVIRTYLTLGKFYDAIETTTLVFQKAKDINKLISRSSDTTCLPYSLAQQVLVAASNAQPKPSNIATLKMVLTNRIQTLQKSSR